MCKKCGEKLEGNTDNFLVMVQLGCMFILLRHLWDWFYGLPNHSRIQVDTQGCAPIMVQVRSGFGPTPPGLSPIFADLPRLSAKKPHLWKGARIVPSCRNY